MCLYSNLLAIWKQREIQYVEQKKSRNDLIIDELSKRPMTREELHRAFPGVEKFNINGGITALLGGRGYRKRIELIGEYYTFIGSLNLREKVLEITKVPTFMADILSGIKGHKGRQITEMVKRLEGRGGKPKLIKHLKNGRYINV